MERVFNPFVLACDALDGLRTPSTKFVLHLAATTFFLPVLYRTANVNSSLPQGDLAVRFLKLRAALFHARTIPRDDASATLIGPAGSRTGRGFPCGTLPALLLEEGEPVTMAMVGTARHAFDGSTPSVRKL